MKYTNVLNPSWNSEKNTIVCDVVLESGEVIPFAATQNDIYAHTIEIYNRCISGEFGEIADYVPFEDELPQSVVINTPVTKGSQDL